MDDFEAASILEEERRQMGIAAEIAKKPSGESAFFCIDEDCGEPIPEDRRLAVAGCQYCAECKNRIEIRKRRYGLNAN